MNQLIFRRAHSDRTIIICPLCFWTILADDLRWLFMSWLMRYFPYLKIRDCFGNPVLFRPQHMPLMRMVQLMLKNFPVVRTWKVQRTVGIPIQNLVVQVDIKVAAWITDPAILYSLAITALSVSPELEKLPRWMRREIRRRARHIKIISTSWAYELVCRCERGNFATSKRLFKSQWLFSEAEITSVSRSLIWKGSAAIARSITKNGLPLTTAKKAVLLSGMHPMCAGIAVSLYNLNKDGYRLAVPTLNMLTALGQWYTGFYEKKAGKRLLSVIYGIVGLSRILQNTGKDLSCLAWQVFLIGRGDVGYLSLEQAGADDRINRLRGLFSDLVNTQVAFDDEPLLTCNATSELADALKADDAEDAGNSVDAAGYGFSLDNHPCTCRCTQHKASSSSTMPKMTADKGGAAHMTVGKESPAPVTPKESSAPEATGKASSAPEATGKASSAPEVTGKASSAPEVTGKASPAPKTTEAEPALKVSQEFLETFAACYAKVTGAEKAPRAVLRAEDLDNSDKSNKNRHINHLGGNTPAISIMAMIEILDILFPGYYITDFVRAENKGEKDTIYLHTNSTQITCPCCGQKWKKAKDANKRTITDTSLRNGIGVQLELTAARYTCKNKECSRYNSCVSEECSFAAPYKKHTKRVEYLALVTGASSSFHDTERQMRFMGIQYGDDRVKNLLMSLKFEDEIDVELVGMDDVSTLKGRSYCTIIYNMANGHMLKLIDGRSGAKFEEELRIWLEQHSKVKVIMRDRAAAYGCYISKFCREHPDRHIIQVADRFHLLQNLSEHLRDAYYDRIPYRIVVSVDDKGDIVLSQKVPKMVAIPVIEKPEGLEDWDYDNEAPKDSMGNLIHIDICVDRVSEKEKARKIQSQVEEFERFRKARDEYKAYMWAGSREDIAQFKKDHGISNAQYNKYVLGMDDAEFEKACEQAKCYTHVSRPKLFDSYKNVTYKMLKDGHSIMDTYWYIKEVMGGWDLSDSTLVDYIMETYKQACPNEPLPLKETLIRMEYPNNEQVFGRQKIFYALMTLDEKKKDPKLDPYLDKICEEYPACESIRSISKEFHDIIIVDKKMADRTEEKCNAAVEKLDVFIQNHRNDELSGFADSLENDIECIKYAITLPYNSGGVEGRNCKYKTILRTFYGHVPLATLEQKLKLEFMYTSEGFSFAEIAPWLVTELPEKKSISNPV